MPRLKLLFLVFIGAAVLTGCLGKKEVREDVMASGDATAAAEVVPEDRTAPGGGVTSEDLGAGKDARAFKYKPLTPGGDELTKNAEENGSLYTVYFDYDMYGIREQDQSLLTKNARWLGLNSDVAIRVEGYADERGESEYNLALGDKRARSVQKYLEDMGVKINRLSTISYGEENPADPNHTEDAWAKNRRVEFKIVR